MAISDPSSDRDDAPPADGSPSADPSDAPPADTDGGEAAAVDNPAAAETETKTATQRDREWTVRYVRDHLVHLLVIAFFGAYPGIYHVLVNSPVSAEMVAILPRVETVVIVFYFGLFAMSFDFVSGYTGYLSFGHAAFYGLGAYFVILTANGKVPVLPSGTPFVVSLLVAGLLAALLAVIIGAVSFRLSGVYFAMITLGFSQVLFVLFANWDYVGENPRDGVAVDNSAHPNGFEIGVPGVDALNLRIGQLVGDQVQNFLGLGWNFAPTEVSYYAIGVVVLLCYFAMQRVLHSPFGRVMVAIRENEERAKAVGYDTMRYKLGAFAISAFFAAVAGGLFAGFARSVAPENSLFFLVAGDALLAAIIGGFGTLAGPLFGWFFYEGITEFLSKAGTGGGLLPYLRSPDTLIGQFLGEATLNTVIYNGFTVGQFIETFLNGRASLYIGVLFVLFVLFVPNGILGTLRDYLGGTLSKAVPAHLDRYRSAYLDGNGARSGGDDE